MNDRQHQEFFRLGMQYYMAGRYAIFAGLNPVAANVLHHATEMFLKGYLSKTLTLKELKNLGHELPKIWAQCKVLGNDPTLNQFDQTIEKLHAFEELRYPDSVLARGMLSTLGIQKAANSAVGGPSSEPTYEIFLEEIDALAAKLFALASVNPPFFVGSLKVTAREYLFKENRFFSAPN